MFRQGRFLLVPMLLASMLSSCHGGTNLSDRQPCPERTAKSGAQPPSDLDADDAREPSQTAYSAPYTLSVYPARQRKSGAKESACLRITDESKLIFELTVPYEDTLEMLTSEGVVMRQHSQARLSQLTTAKQPNFVLLQRSPSHGTNCSVYSLSNECSVLARFDLDGGTAQLESLEPGSDRARLVITDWYKEWGIQPVAAEVVLKWDGAKFILDAAEMRKRCHDLRNSAGFRAAMHDMFETVDRDSALPINYAPPEVSEQIIGLAYAGKLSAARSFLEEIWPKNQPGREKYWQFMLSEMEKSSFWPQIKKLNGLK